jgi:adenylate kinase family enzyme
MKIILLGNAGAGKSTLSKKLIAKHPTARLSLDEVAFQDGTERHPLQDSIEDVKRWIADNESWIIEGCYAEIIEPLLESCDELIFLNPGVDVCIAHCRSRPWEPENSTTRFMARSVNSMIRVNMHRYNNQLQRTILCAARS